jgi:hypothetical protein
MHLVQNPRQSKVDNENNVRREASRHCRSRKKGTLTYLFHGAESFLRS